MQGEDDQFAVRLRRKAQQCDYGDQMEAQIRDQIISKDRFNELRRKAKPSHFKPYRRLPRIMRQ